MRRKLIGVFVLLASLILGICAQIVWLSGTVSSSDEPEALQGTVSQHYELDGYYHPAHELPWAFYNVTRIDLMTADFRVNSSVTKTPSAPKGYLVTDFDIYKLSSVNIDGARLSFTTERHLGVSYQFTGRVLQGDYPIQGYRQYYVGKTIMFDGRMVRMLFGFKVAESEVRFTKGSGC